MGEGDQVLLLTLLLFLYVFSSPSLLHSILSTSLPQKYFLLLLLPGLMVNTEDR